MVLRHPRAEAASERMRRDRLTAFQVDSHAGFSWRASPLAAEDRVYYGDIIKVKKDSDLYLVLHGQYQIRLAADTTIAILPNFIRLFQRQGVSPTIQLIQGRVRVTMGAVEEGQDLVLRSKTMAAHFDAADALFRAEPRVSRLLVLSGDGFARRLGQQDRELYEQGLKAYRRKAYKRLAQLTRQRFQRSEQAFATVGSGQQLAAWVALDQQEKRELKRLLGPARAAAHIAQVERFEVAAFQAGDLDGFGALAEELPDSQFDMVGSGLTPDDFAVDESELGELDDAGLEQLLTDVEPPKNQAKTKESAAEPTGPDQSHQHLAVHLAYTAMRSQFRNERNVRAQGLALALEFRPWRYIYSSLAFASGTIDSKGMADYLGEGAPQPLNSYSHLAVAAGGRLPLFDELLSLSLGAGAVYIPQITIQYDDSPGNINRTYTVSLDPLPVAEAGLAVRLGRHVELFAKYRLGQGQAQLEAKDISDRYNSHQDLSLATVGLTWVSD
jgi:hypothetical protein